MFVKEGRFYGLELKTEAGRLSGAQQLAHVSLITAGAQVAVAYGLDEAIHILKRWEIVP